MVRETVADLHPKSAERFPWLDVLRAFAIGDIVAYHTANEHMLGGMGLPVFILCTIALGARRTPPHPWKENLTRRASRLLIPWLFWSAFYAIVNTYRAKRSGVERFGDITDPQWSMLWRGTEELLWYLPFAFCAEVLVNLILHATDRYHNRSPRLATGFWLVLGMVLPTALALAFGDNARPPIMRSWSSGAILIPAGIGLGLLLRYYGRHIIACATLIVSGVLMMLFNVLVIDEVARHAGDYMTLWQWRLGLSMVLIGLTLCVPFRTPKLALWFASFTFPIYLLHVFVAWPVRRVFEVGLKSLPDVPFWLAVWGLTLALAILLKRTPWVKRFC